MKTRRKPSFDNQTALLPRSAHSERGRQKKKRPGLKPAEVLDLVAAQELLGRQIVERLWILVPVASDAIGRAILAQLIGSFVPNDQSGFDG